MHFVVVVDDAGRTSPTAVTVLQARTNRRKDNLKAVRETKATRVARENRAARETRAVKATRVARETRTRAPSLAKAVDSAAKVVSGGASAVNEARVVSGAKAARAAVSVVATRAVKATRVVKATRAVRATRAVKVAAGDLVQELPVTIDPGTGPEIEKTTAPVIKKIIARTIVLTSGPTVGRRIDPIKAATARETKEEGRRNPDPVEDPIPAVVVDRVEVVEAPEVVVEPAVVVEPEVVETEDAPGDRTIEAGDPAMVDRRKPFDPKT